MTPAATTPAAKAARRTVHGGRAAPAPRPRRVSGPAGGAPRAAAAARAAAARTAGAGTAIPAPVFAPPRRVSGPARRSPAKTPQPARPSARGRSASSAHLPDHSLLDRLIRGRVWIALLGVMLVGIVAMQVEVLKLGASMGRNIRQATVLQGHNEALRASVAALADDQRIEALAAKQGMVMPAPSDVAFLPVASTAVVQRAVSDIHAPAPASFLTANTGNGAVTTAANARGRPRRRQRSAGAPAQRNRRRGRDRAPRCPASTSSAAAPSAASATIPIAGSTSSTGN